MESPNVTPEQVGNASVFPITEEEWVLGFEGLSVRQFYQGCAMIAICATAAHPEDRGFENYKEIADHARKLAYEMQKMDAEQKSS